VRLDHLLSKELSRGPRKRVARSQDPLTVLVAPGSRSLAIRSGRSPARLVPPREGCGTADRVGPGPRTLLSFEGASPLGAASTSPRGSVRTPNRPAPSGQAGRRTSAGNLENYIASASIFRSCQVTKGTRWMPRRQKPMKDVGGCDKPRGAANQALIRGCPNGETRHGSCRVTPV
jgi:hypothetical protein